MIQHEAAKSEIHAGFYSSPFQKTERQILVLQTWIAGTKYHVDEESGEGNSLFDELKPGTELKLYHDVDNEHDKWAVAVYTLDDKEIGYISRFKNETICRLLDAGKVFKAYVEELKEVPEDPVERRRNHAPTEGKDIYMSVYLCEG